MPTIKELDALNDEMTEWRRALHQKPEMAYHQQPIGRRYCSRGGATMKKITFLRASWAIIVALTRDKSIICWKRTSGLVCCKLRVVCRN